MAALLDTADHLDDHRLVAHAASVIGVPRAEVTGDGSIVLHAPLELLARAALLPHVQPGTRDRARARIALLADRYEESGPPRPPAATRFTSPAAAAQVLQGAAVEGDVGTADGAAAWLGDHARPDELIALLGDLFLPSLEAAGHANIYLALLDRTQPRGLPNQMLRHPVAALTSPTPRHIPPPAAVAETDGDNAVTELIEAIRSVPVIGPAPAYGIAALVQHAHPGALDQLCDDHGTFHAPPAPPFQLLRFAGHAMLQGPPDYAPFGWTHCLTLAQAPLLMATRGADERHATFVAATYLAAHWATLGHGTVELDHIPEPTSTSFGDALHASPNAAAAAAWHTDDPAETATILATAASVNNDAHRVKYTLACLDSAALDPTASRLYLAAAAYLNAWWEAHPDHTDPMPELATVSDGDLSTAT